MKLKEYLSTLERSGASQLAKLLEISISYLSQLASGTSSISPTRCVDIERAAGGKVTRQALRDDWHLIWPELAAASAPPSRPTPARGREPAQGAGETKRQYARQGQEAVRLATQ